MNKTLVAVFGVLVLTICIAQLPVGSQEELDKTENYLLVEATKTTLGIGESAQLKVTLRRQSEADLDVTDVSFGTRYSTTSESMLIPESDGRITCVGTDGKPLESANVSAYYGKAVGHIRLHLKADGPGPTLEILPKKTTLEEGESVQFRVRNRYDKADVTTQSSGTNYAVFSGNGVPDSKVVQIDSEKGILKALDSLGRFQWLSPIIFVRNGESVGWIELRIVKKGRKKN